MWQQLVASVIFSIVVGVVSRDLSSPPPFLENHYNRTASRDGEVLVQGWGWGWGGSNDLPVIPEGEDEDEVKERIKLTFDSNHFRGTIRVADKNYQVAISFASSRLWIFGTGAEDYIRDKDNFRHHTYYDKELPKKMDPNDDSEDFVVEYLDGTVFSGRVVKLPVEIGGKKLKQDIRVGVVTTFRVEDKTWQTSMDGVLGLGFGDHIPYETPATDIPWMNLPPTSPELFPRFSLYVKKDGMSGQLHIGGTDETLYHGPLTHVPVVANPTPPGWTITLESFQMGTKSLTEAPVPIEVNIGSNSQWAPRSVIEAIIKDVTKGEAEWIEPADGKPKMHVKIDCSKRDTLPDLIYVFNGVPHAFEPHEYFPEFLVPGYRMKDRMCTLFMLPSEALEMPEAKRVSKRRVNNQQLWGLGVPFFKKFYATFGHPSTDRLLNWQVGFALAKHSRDVVGEEEGQSS